MRSLDSGRDWDRESEKCKRIVFSMRDCMEMNGG
jgi:hypothetical protein